MFISWQPVLTDHQAFTFQALGQQAGVPVLAYVTTMEDVVRKAQGWSDTQVASVERRLIPRHGFLRYCYRQLYEYRAAVHVFASPFEQPRLIICILFAAWFGIEFYLISEPYSPRADGYLRDTSQRLGKFKATLRPWLYRCYALLLRNHVAGIFAISWLAVTQYRQVGIPPAKIFPFGYFVPFDDTATLLVDSRLPVTSFQLRIIFVGSLIRRKGVDLLQDAVQQLHARGCKVSVDVYGPGDGSSIVSKDGRICYRGTIPFGHAQRVIGQYDLLVLPSRYDGWGVVVNEALCAGVPVVCSDTTGAGAVAVALGAGLSFTSGDSTSLSVVLADLVADPSLLESMRIAAPFAANALQPSVAARYMLEVIQATGDLRAKIRSPWYSNHVCSIKSCSDLT